MVRHLRRDMDGRLNACIRRKMEADLDNATANAIRSGMIERRQRSIAEAESLMAQLNVVTAE